MTRVLAVIIVVTLAGCATTPEPPRVITRPETVVRQVPVHADLPANLTGPLEIPSLPQGEVLNRHLTDHISQLYDALDQANADRARVRELEARSRLGREDDRE